MKQIRVHKIASTTIRLGLGRELHYLEEGMPAEGAVVVVEALEEKRVYATMELVSGRMAKILKGDIIASVLGSRMALKGFVGRVPERLAPGDSLSILNLGGVVGECTSRGGDLGRPLETRFLGMVVDESGRVLNVRDNALPVRDEVHEGAAPVILVAGSCMNSGKTIAACEIIAGLTERGMRVAAGKIAGVACLRDLLNMEDHGAVKALSFLDCGYPSTARFETVAPLTKGILAGLAEHEPDVVVLEQGDGIIGGYGPDSYFADAELREATAVVVFCGSDLVSAWGGRKYLEEKGVDIDILSGPATDNEVGIEYSEKTLGVPAANSQTDPKRLTGLVVQALSRARRAKES